MRLSILMLIALSFCVSSACDKKTKTQTDQAASAGASLADGPRGGSEADCLTVCEKGPRLHFEAALAAELRRKPEEEHAKIKAGAEEQWKAIKVKSKGRVEGCVKQCVKTAKPGEVKCLAEAKDMAETQACVRRFQSRKKGSLPKPSPSTTTHSKDQRIPGAVRQPHLPNEPSVHGPKVPSAAPANMLPKGKLPVPSLKAPALKASPRAPKVKSPAAGLEAKGPEVKVPSLEKKPALPADVAVPEPVKK
jgi:hypothetical protein